ncbi:MAG: winged helix-turn-helix transcriptional regulator [Verrucomicrobiae bacterium]|nr:winged helix-turn-helix transcriptional regulator [Verrucomicrobiae bacterium]
MEYIEIYKCLCERTRLRILNLLRDGPLCVCHLHEILGEAQPNVSKQLAYLRDRGAVESERHNTWIMYRLPGRRHPILEKNLRCLQDVAREDGVFRRDLAHRAAVVRRIARTREGCPEEVAGGKCC